MANVTDTVTELLQNPFEWNSNDCLSLVERVAGIQRPPWADTATEAGARAKCLHRFDTEWHAVAEYLDSQLTRLDADAALRPGDVVITPYGQDWEINNGRLRIKAKFQKWCLGVLDESLNVVSYNYGHIITFGPVGTRWRAG